MKDQETDAERFLKDADVTIGFKECGNVADRVQGSGFYNPYKVIFSCDTQQVEVIIFLDTMRPQPTTSVQVLSALSYALEAVEGSSSFSEWCTALVKKHPKSYDARQVPREDRPICGTDIAIFAGSKLIFRWSFPKRILLSLVSSVSGTSYMAGLGEDGQGIRKVFKRKIVPF